jgi:hypothetical protein
LVVKEKLTGKMIFSFDGFNTRTGHPASRSISFAVRNAGFPASSAALSPS